MATAKHHIFGIRHHGPGSARSLLAALAQLQPDCVLVEGPPDADALIPLAGHAEMKPPVALLLYAADDARRAVYYPFAEFSPEWQAIRFALARQIPVRFCDLPLSHQFGLETSDASQAPAAISESDPPAKMEPGGAVPGAAIRRDPLGALAAAAGYSDGERWWECVVEARVDAQDAFAAVSEAMAELRAGDTLPPAPREQLREAWMRQTIRAAGKEGFTRIAVVCGAWHAPALAEMPAAKDDAALLKGLSKIKVLGTWIPWSHSRLTYASGYGAGIQSPGYYEHLWKHHADTTVRWMSRAARLFRDEQLDCSSAHIIEAVRLADTLASIRGLSVPTLAELNEASSSVFCFDSDLPMQLIQQRLVVGDRLGEVPDDAPSVPLQQDLQREQKRLRLPPQELEKTLDLDLRKDTDRDRSRMLHRLNLLSVPWGQLQRGNHGKGTFHEIWTLRWDVEFAVRIAEMGVWGNTLAGASSSYVRDAARSAELPVLCGLIDAVLLAHLPDAVQELMLRLENQAALAADITHLMAAMPPLANILRYGNVRQTDTSMVSHVVTSLVTRICIGLPAACASLNDEAAETMLGQIMAVHAAIPLLESDAHSAAWQDLLTRLAETPSLHGLLAGRAHRLLLDAHATTPDAAATAMSLALSTANDPAYAAAWIEGFLHGSGIILLHDDALWEVLSDWVQSLSPGAFTQLLPILRRTFSEFPAPERRQIGQRVQGGRSRAGDAAAALAEIDERRAALVLPVLKRILGLPPSVEAMSS